MIQSIKHRGLRRLYNGRTNHGLPPEYVEKLRDILLMLDQSRTGGDMNLPGYGLHGLTGNLAGYLAVTVSRNWRVTFRIEDSDAFDVDYVDYH